MEHILTHIAGFIVSIIEKTGYLGIFILMTLESALIPIPSEITMPFGGYLVSIKKMNLHILSFVGAFANLAGSILAYWLGFWAEERMIRRWIKTRGKFLLITEDDYDRAEMWFKKYGNPIVFFSRLMPGVRTFISLPAGVAKTGFSSFCILTFFGSLLWSYFLSYIGFFLGKNWAHIEYWYRKFEYIILFGIIATVVWVILHKIKRIKNL